MIDDYVNEEYLSECCGRPIDGEVTDGLGICSGCGEWSGVSKDPEFEKLKDE